MFVKGKMIVLQSRAVANKIASALDFGINANWVPPISDFVH